MVEQRKDKDNLLVVFHNNFNKAAFPNFSEHDWNLFLGIIGSLRNKGGEEVTIPYSTAMDWAGKISTNPYEVKRFISSVADKAAQTIIPFYVVDGDEGDVLMRIPFFSFLSTNESKLTIGVKINPELEYLLNNLDGDFSKLVPTIAWETKSRYSKSLYRLLVQYGKTGWMEKDKDELRRLLDCPKKYANKMFHSRVLTVAISELSETFEDLTVKYLYTGRAITGYRFTWSKYNEPMSKKKTKKAKKKKDVTPIKDPELAGLTEEEIKILKDKY